MFFLLQEQNSLWTGTEQLWVEHLLTRLRLPSPHKHSPPHISSSDVDNSHLWGRLLIIKVANNVQQKTSFLKLHTDWMIEHFSLVCFLRVRPLQSTWGKLFGFSHGLKQCLTLFKNLFNCAFVCVSYVVTSEQRAADGSHGAHEYSLLH